MTPERINIPARGDERLRHHASLFSVVRHHAATEEKTMTLRFAKELFSAAARQPLVGQAERVTGGSAENASNDVCLCHTEVFFSAN
jgi:hypothetical protein